MDYIAGGSLADAVAPLDHSVIVTYVTQAARAAHALHEVGVVHQGIRPKSILVGDGQAFLADLGLAQLISQDSFVTSIGQFGGLEFIDPALLTGAAGSRASDLWSLAATLNRALAGVGVYGPMSTDPLLAIRAVLTQKAAPSQGLPPELAAIVSSCLDPDPASRPATALELAKRLEASRTG